METCVKKEVHSDENKTAKTNQSVLEEEFGKERGGALFNAQEKTLDTLIGHTENKSENQMKTLAQTILPRIALYKALSEAGFSEEEVYASVRKYMLEVVAAKKHSSTAKMETVPGFSLLKKTGMKD